MSPAHDTHRPHQRPPAYKRSILIPEILRDQLYELADLNGRTLADEIRQALQLYVSPTETIARGENDKRTPSRIVAASQDPDCALAAFIGQELEHWGFWVEAGDISSALTIKAGALDLSVEVWRQRS